MDDETSNEMNALSENLWHGRDDGNDTGYSLNKFYTISSDKKGFSSTIHTPVPKYLIGQIASIIQQQKIKEYRTAQDFVRDAIMHRLHWVGTYLTDDSLVQYTEREMAETVNNRLIEKHAYEMKELDKFRDALMTFRYDKNYQAMKSLIETKTAIVPQIPEPYRTRTVDVIEQFARDAQLA